MIHLSGSTTIVPLETSLESSGATYFWFCSDLGIVNSFILEGKVINHPQRLGKGLLLSEKGNANVVSMQRKHFAEWAASTATSTIVKSALQTTSVTDITSTQRLN